MLSKIAPNVAGALVRLLAGSLVALVFAFRCGDTQASTPLPVGGVSEIAQTAPTPVQSTERPTIAPTIAPTIVPTTAPVPSPTQVQTAAPTPTQVQTAAPTLTPSPTPLLPTVPSTPSPILTPSPMPSASPTPQPTASPALEPAASPSPIPTAAPTQQPTASPSQRATATLTPRPTATPTQKPNSPPQIERIGDQSGKVGQQFVIGVSASDPDGGTITLGCGGADKFTDNGNGSGTFVWTGTKAGKYAFNCSASDGKLSTSTTFTITVS